MNNGLSHLFYFSAMLFGLILIIVGTILLFFLDILVSINFAVIVSLVLIGFMVLSLCINWLNVIISSNLILSNVINFIGFMIGTLGFWFLLVRTFASPPIFATNDIGIYWFTQSFNLLWSFLPLIVIFFGYFLHKIGEFKPKFKEWD